MIIPTHFHFIFPPYRISNNAPFPVRALLLSLSLCWHLDTLPPQKLAHFIIRVFLSLTHISTWFLIECDKVLEKLSAYQKWSCKKHCADKVFFDKKAHLVDSVFQMRQPFRKAASFACHMTRLYEWGFFMRLIFFSVMPITLCQKLRIYEYLFTFIFSLLCRKEVSLRIFELLFISQFSNHTPMCYGQYFIAGLLQFLGSYLL